MKRTPRERRQPKGDYAVGYARPPEHTRFPHQKNPNRSGRPKKELSEFLHKALYRPVTLTENGKRQRMPSLAALMESLTRLAVRGDAKARRDLLEILKRYPNVVKRPRELRTITPDMSSQEASRIYAETLTPIPGMTDSVEELKFWDED
jgi:hypothetical protein